MIRALSFLLAISHILLIPVKLLGSFWVLVFYQDRDVKDNILYSIFVTPVEFLKITFGE